MAWPTWLVPEAQASRNLNGVSRMDRLGSAETRMALPACESSGVPSPRRFAVTSVVVKPMLTTRIAPLHDLSPGSSDVWLVGRWVRWGCDKLNAIDQKTAEKIPQLERGAAAAKRKLKLAVQKEITNQFPPLQVYLADRAFALDEARNIEMEAARKLAAELVSEATDVTTTNADENSINDILTVSNEVIDTHIKPKDGPIEQRRKLTDFFSTSSETAVAAVETESSTTATIEAETHVRLRTQDIEVESKEDPEARTQTTHETQQQREARWAREGAALAASLAASPKPKTPVVKTRSNAVSKTRVPSGVSPCVHQQRVSRRRAEASAAPVVSAPRLTLAPKSNSSHSPTCLAAPTISTMNRPTRRTSAPKNSKPLQELPEPTASRRDLRDDIARQERRAHREARREARRAGDENVGSSKVENKENETRSERRSNSSGGVKNVRPSRSTDDAVERMFAKTLGATGTTETDGTPSKTKGRAFSDIMNTKNENSLTTKLDEFRTSLSAFSTRAASVIAELADTHFDGNGEFQTSNLSHKDKTRVEHVYTMSVDGADVLVQTREVTVQGKQV